MKTLTAIVLTALVLSPAIAVAQATDVTCTWNATFTRTSPEGQTQTAKVTFHFTQKGKVLTGTIGPDDARQWKVEKGVVAAGKVTFQVQQPDGPLRTFTLTIVKGKLQGTQKLEFQGQTAEVKVEAERAK